MAAESAPSEIIERQRKQFLNILQQDPDSILDTLTSRRLISEEEYETLDKITDPLKKSRKLLILVQKKGEVSCQYFLKCLLSTFPESAPTWGLQHELLKHKDIASPQSIRKNSENSFSPGKEKNKNPEIKVSSREKEHLDLKTSAFSRDKKTSYQETALSSREKEKEYDTPKITWPCSVKRVEYEIPATITYLKDGQRYEEPDDTLYLGEGEHPGSAECIEDAETTVEGDYDVPEHAVHGGKEDSECSESMGFPDENISEESETSISLEDEDKNLEERKKVFKELLSCLNVDRNRKLLPDFVKQFSLDHGCRWTPETPADLPWNFLMKVQALDVTARDSILRRRVLDEDSKEELLTALEKLEIQDLQTINPLDVLCATMLCAHSSLQREVMSNMYQCQFALPLLLPDLENNKSILMLGAMKGIVKKQSTQSSGGPMGDSEKFLSLMKVPVISFVRLGHCRFSKSRILNALLIPDQLKSHKIFLHQDLSVPVLPRQISDGLVEIAWCFPDSDDQKESPGIFPKPVAMTNLHGDLGRFWTQFGLLVEVSSAIFCFTDCLGKKEWDLLLFLGEDAIQRCYFVLSPQAKVSEEAQIFQRTLKLKPLQLLFWEEAGDKKKNMEGLRAAFQEVMSSSLRRVSVEDMASLARELGIQVDQDFENAQGIQVFPNVNTTATADGEGQQRCSQPKSSTESKAQRPPRQPGAACEVSQNFQNFNHSPVFVSHLEDAWPSPNRIGGDFDHVSLESPWVMGSHSGSEQRSQWFCASSFWNSRCHKKGKGFGIQYSQPQRFYSGEKFIKFSSTSSKHHSNRTFGRPLRLSSQSVWACPERPQTMGVLEKFGAVVSVVGHLHSLGSQPAGPAGRPQPRQAQAPGTKLTQVTGEFMRTASHIKVPHPQCFLPTGNTQKLVRPASQQGKQLMAQGGSSDSVFQTGFHSTSKSKLLPNSQFISHQPRPSQVKHFQPKSSQPGSSQAKPSQTKTPRPQSSQAKPSQPRPIQPKSSQTHHSQTRAYQPRAGPKRVGKR